VNHRMMAGVLGGDAVATSTSAVLRRSGGCWLTTRFLSTSVPPHRLLTVHTTTVFTIFDEVKVKTYCLLLWPAWHVTVPIKIWYSGIFAHDTSGNKVWFLVHFFFRLFKVLCIFRFVVWLCIVRIYIHSLHVKAVMHLLNVANVSHLLFSYQWL
jgi:hypothetical protein